MFESPAPVSKGKAGVVIGTCDPGDAGHLRDTGFSHMLVTSHVSLPFLLFGRHLESHSEQNKERQH